MEELMVIIDAGHGVDTNGKRYIGGGDSLYEWEFNRQIANKLARKLYELGVAFYYNPTVYDTPLEERVSEYNAVYNRSKAEYKPIVISIHGNAASTKSANGFEAFTYIGQTESDDLAEKIILQFDFLDLMVIRKDCSDGDLDKEARFIILRDTIPPAVLVELGFYTNDLERKNMYNNEWQEKVVEALVNGIMDWYYNI